MKSEITVICWYISTLIKCGCRTSFKLYHRLSEYCDAKINVIVPWWIDYYKSKMNFEGDNVRVFYVAPEYGMFHEDHTVFKTYFPPFPELCESLSLRNKIYEIGKKSDVIICDSVWFVSLAKEIFPQKKIIFRVWDIEYNKALWYKELHGFNDRINDNDLKFIYNYEQKAVKDADLIWESSKEEAEAFQKLYNVSSDKIKVLPICLTNSSILKNYIPKQRKKGDITKFLIISDPDLDFLDSITNYASKRNDVEFHIIGRSGSEFDNRHSNIIRYGVVSDDKLYEITSFCDAALNVSKMTYGINSKILDYFSLGIPVLSNKCGVRGFDAKPGKHYIEMELDDFNIALDTFCNMDDSQRYEIALNAYYHICENYNYDNYISLFEDLTHKKEWQYYILGAGYAGQTVLLQIERQGDKCIGFIDNDTARQNTYFRGKKIFSPDEAFEYIDLHKEQNIGVIIAVGPWNITDVLKQTIKKIDPERIRVVSPHEWDMCNVDFDKLNS